MGHRDTEITDEIAYFVLLCDLCVSVAKQLFSSCRQQGEMELKKVAFDLKNRPRFRSENGLVSVAQADK